MYDVAESSGERNVFRFGGAECGKCLHLTLPQDGATRKCDDVSCTGFCGARVVAQLVALGASKVRVYVAL